MNAHMHAQLAFSSLGPTHGRQVFPPQDNKDNPLQTFSETILNLDDPS